MKITKKVDLSGCVLARLTLEVTVESDEHHDRVDLEQEAIRQAFALCDSVAAWRLQTTVENICVDDIYTTEEDRLPVTWRKRSTPDA